MRNMRKDGRETWHRLLEWDKGSAPSERLSALILHSIGCKNIDPSHPLGGKDGIKDIVCNYNGVKYVAGCYFPRGKKKDIKSKFQDDYKGVDKNNAQGFFFITNQELTLKERDDLIDLTDEKIQIEIIHLETLCSILNTPTMYGIRLEFLDIEMTKEDQLSFYSQQNDQITKLTQIVIELSNKLKDDKITAPPHAQSVIVNNSMCGDRHHDCRSCGFGYLIQSIDISSVNYTAVYSLFAIGSVYVICPKCGNLDSTW